MPVKPASFVQILGALLRRIAVISLALPVVALLGSLFSAAPARAQLSCTVTVSPLAFPTNMDVLPGAAFDSASSISSACTGIPGSAKVLLCLALTTGTYPASGGWQQMGSGANRLGFNAYTDASRTNPWTTTATGMIRITLSATTPSTTTPYYGRVAAGQPTAVPGAYSTTMNVTTYSVNFGSGAAPACPSSVMSTTTFGVTGTVVSSCLVTATNMVFAPAVSLASNRDASSTIGVTCTNTTPYHVRLNGGISGATNPTLRKLSLGATTITYGLYRDVARTLGWGSTDGVDTADGTGTATSTSHTVYGRIPPQATPPAGTYSDTIVVTVSFL